MSYTEGICRARQTLNSAFAGGAAICAILASASAQDATWLQNPVSADWNTGANWSTGTVPTGIATFGASNSTTLTFSTATTTLQAIKLTSVSPGYIFKSNGASDYKIVLNGTGIVDQSATGMTLGIVTELHNAASAGSAIVKVKMGSGISGGADYIGGLKFYDTATAGTANLTATFTGDGRASLIEFHDSSSAGSAAIHNNQTAATNFYDNSSAANATITNDGPGFLSSNQGGVNFYGTSTAGNATITGYATFNQNSTGGNATISGADVIFLDNATAGNATIIVDNNWTSKFSGLNSQSTARLVFNTTHAQYEDTVSQITVGSIEGSASVIVGNTTITVGKNDLSTTFSGSICERYICLDTWSPLKFGTASFTKTGTGTLTFNGSLDVTGGTTVSSGKMVFGDANPHLGSSYSALIGGNVQVGASAQVSGTGYILGTLRNDQGGTVAPGASVGALRAGSYVQSANSTLGITVDNSGASLLGMDSSASLNGTLLLNFASGFLPTQPSQTYTILTAPTIAGQFSTVTATGVNGFSYAINYFPSLVQLFVLAQNGAIIDTAFANATTPYDARPNSVLLGVMDIVSPRPISLGGPVTVDSVNHTIGLSGVISGTGPLTIAGTGTIILTAANTYTSGTVVNSNATLQIGNGGTTGSITGDVTTNGALVFNHSDAVTFGGAITGTGSLTQKGAGALILTGQDSNSGGIWILNGTLQIGNGGTAGSIGSNVVDNGTLAFNRSDTASFTNRISGTGGLNQMGPGTLILAGSNTYTGSTLVSGGTLIVNGSSTSSTFLVSGGTLLAGDSAHPGTVLSSNVTVTGSGIFGGYGTVFGAVGNSGTVAPGASIGTLTLSTYTQSGSGKLAIEVTPTANDALHVLGAASLDGALNVMLAQGSYGASERTVASAASVSGTFASFTVGGAADQVAVGVRYDANNADIVIEPRREADLYSGYYRQSLSEADTISDLVFTHLQTTYCKDQDGTTGRANEPNCPELSVWYQGYGSIGVMDGAGDVRYFYSRSAGLIGGFDYRYDDGTQFGVTGAYSRGMFNREAGSGKITTDLFAIAMNGGMPLLGGRVEIDLQFLTQTGNAARKLATDGQGQLTAVSHPKSKVLTGAVQYDHSLYVEGLDAFARLSYSRASLQSFSESGAAGFDFTLPAQGKSRAYADVGVRINQIFKLRSGSILIPEISGAVRADLTGNTIAAKIGLADASGTTFIAPAVAPNRASFILGFGVTAENRNGFELYFRGNGRISGNQREGVASFGSRYTF